MDQRISLITLGVADVTRARRFYEDLGWSGESPDGEVVFYQAGGMVLALWGRDKLAEDSAVEDPGGWGGVTLAYNVGSPEEVDRVLAQARAAGRREDRPAGSADVLGWVFRHLHRPGRPPLGGRAQPRLDGRCRRQRSPSLTRPHGNPTLAVTKTAPGLPNGLDVLHGARSRSCAE